MLKFDDLRRQGVDVNEATVLETLTTPDRILTGFKGRRVAQAPLDDDRILRVVYEETAEETVIVTFYPARSGRYETDAI